MRKTFDIDESLLKEAKAACGALTDTETVHQGLQALIRRAAYARLSALQGSELSATDVPRRREKASRKHRVVG